MPETETEETETETEDVEEPDVEDVEDQAAGDDERPAIEPDEQAEMDLSGVDLDAIDDPGDDDQDDGEGDADDAEQDGDDAEDDGGIPDPTGDGGVSWGDAYVDVLATVLVAVVDEYGDDDSGISATDIQEMANQPPIALDEQADRVFQSMTGAEALPPGQALVLGTATVACTVVLTETDAASQVLDELDGRIGGGAV